MSSTTIKAEFAEDLYPIGRFILERARSRGMSHGDLVRRLGCRDTESGHEALTAALLNGLVAPQGCTISPMPLKLTTPWSGP
jgi:hypothetical protein